MTVSRLSVSVAATAVLLVAVGCSSESRSDSDPGASTPSTASGAQTTETTDAAVEYPVPPGAEGWPVRDVATCSDLGAITEPELIVRVAVATPDCIQYPETSDVLVIATGRAQVGIGKETEVNVPGFDGEVRAIRSPVNRGTAYSAQPSAGDVTWLVLWDGGTGSTIEQILVDLLVSS